MRLPLSLCMYAMCSLRSQCFQSAFDYSFVESAKPPFTERGRENNIALGVCGFFFFFTCMWLKLSSCLRMSNVMFK